MINETVLMGMLLAAGGGILYSLKTIPLKGYNKLKSRLIYNVKIYQYDNLFDMVEKWLSVNHTKQYRDVEASLIPTNGTVPETRTGSEKQPSLVYKQEDNTFVIKYGGKRLLITKTREKLEKANNLREIFFRRYTITSYRGKKATNQLLNDIIDYCRAQEEKNTIYVHSNTSYGEWYNGSSIRVKPLEKTILNETKKKFILDDLDTFVNSEEWYVNTSIPYKRGYCFYGPPGTGKTTLALGIANHLKRNIYCLNLNSIEDDSRLPRAFESIPANSILLIEDIDKVFSGRENMKEGSKITFSSLLNCLDGAFYKHGLMTIITTNHIEKLDSALLRTGRIDNKMEIPLPSDKEISLYLSIFYGNDIHIEGNFNITMSDVQEICLRNRYCLPLAKNEIIALIK